MRCTVYALNIYGPNILFDYIDWLFKPICYI